MTLITHAHISAVTDDPTKDVSSDEWNAAHTIVAALLLDVVPASPHTLDDEFPGSSLDGKWSTITSNAGNETSATVANGWCVIEPNISGSGSTGKRAFGIKQTASVPAGDFQIMAKMARQDVGAGDTRIGIFVATTAGKAHLVGFDTRTTQKFEAMAISVTTYSATADWSTYDGTYASYGLADNLYKMAWFRLRWNSATSTLYWDVSYNGVLWTNLGNRASLAQPTAVGIVEYDTGATVPKDEQCAVKWFRCLASAAF